MGYRDLDMTTFLQRNEVAQARRTGGGADYFKPVIGTVERPGRNVVRVLPPHENMDDWCVESTMHFMPEKGATGPQRKVIGIACLAQFSKACPCCAVVVRMNEQAKMETNPDAAARITQGAKDCAAKLRVFANIIDIDHPEKGVQRYGFGPDVQKKLGRAFFDDDGNARNITHPLTGRDVILSGWKKLGTNYNDYEARPKERESPLGDMGWLDLIGDLTDQLKEPPLAEAEAAARGERVQAPAAGTAGTAARPATAPRPVTAPVTKPPTATAPKATAPVVPPKAVTPPVTKPAVKPAAAAPAAVAPAVVKPPSKRQPIATAPEPEPEPEPEEDTDPYAAARATAAEHGFVPPEITPEEEESLPKPPCYTEETDPTDAMCQGCRVFLPCQMAKFAAAA